MRSDEGDEGQMWAVRYDDGMSLTTASERIARGLAKAERQRGRRVTVQRLDDVETHPRGATGGADSAPEPQPIRSAPELSESLEPARTPEQPEPLPARQASPPEVIREPEPARAATPAKRRRLVLYALAAASIAVAAALADHWGALPRVGASTSSSPTQARSPAYRPQLLPPLDQPPVMHFSNAVNATAARRGRH